MNKFKSLTYAIGRILRKFIKVGFFGGIILFIIINITVYFYGKRYIYNDVNKVPNTYTAIIPGASVYSDGSLSPILYDRVTMGIKLYKKGKIKRFLVSGDHGTRNYDEVNNMKSFMLRRGVKKSDIFLDHAGFDTYSTLVRAQKIFMVKDVIFVSQKYHLSRALFIARFKGLKAYGFEADRRKYIHIRYYKFRELLANIKAFYEVFTNASPRYLGKKIPITGSSKVSWD